jgi:hypothetical protein
VISPAVAAAAGAAAVTHSFQAWYLPKAKNLLAFKNVSC